MSFYKVFKLLSFICYCKLKKPINDLLFGGDTFHELVFRSTGIRPYPSRTKSFLDWFDIRSKTGKLVQYLTRYTFVYVLKYVVKNFVLFSDAIKMLKLSESVATPT